VFAAVGFTPWAAAPTSIQAGHLRKVTLALRNNLVYAPSLTTGTYGDRACLIVGYGPAATPGSLLTIEAEIPASGYALASVWYDRWLAQTLATASQSITIGSATGNTHKITFGSLKIEGPPRYSYADGALIVTVTCRVLGSAAGVTNDDVTIEAY
jgi:hypothetical protein